MIETTTSKSRLWAGRILSWLVILFMLFDAVMKFAKPEEVVTTTVNELGYKEDHIVVLGVIGLVVTLLYALPRTAVLGAILMTGYLGGAVATHLRVNNPLFSHELFPVYIGLMAWIGLWLRDIRLRYLIPVRQG